MRLGTRLIPFVSALLFCMPAWSVLPRFQTESSTLSVEKRKLYLEVEKTLNSWTGESEKLVAAGVMIDNFIQTNPNFLPIYVEKARREIMLGAVGTNDPIKANLKALKILADIQAKDPNYPKSYVVAGHALLNIGDLEGSRKSLERAAHIGTTDPWLYSNFADYYARKQQYDLVLVNARKALLLSNDNSKALVSAVYTLSKYSQYASQSSGDVDIAQLVFDSFKDPEQRLRIATRLTYAYGGDQTILDRAFEIIDRQGKETPQLESVHLAMAEWLLKKGYLKDRSNIARYDPRLSAAAETILEGIKPSKALADRLFSLRLSIALSNDDIQKATALVKDAEAAGLSPNVVLEGKGYLQWSKGDYRAVVETFERLAKADPVYANHSLLMIAYSRLGRPDMLAAYHKRNIERDPTNAWGLGNYAGFLLFTMHDVDGAIEYGDKTLNQMKYPIAENTTALAYLMKASILKRAGNLASSKSHVNHAMSIGFSESYVLGHCEAYCADIQEMLERP